MSFLYAAYRHKKSKKKKKKYLQNSQSQTSLPNFTDDESSCVSFFSEIEERAIDTKQAKIDVKEMYNALQNQERPVSNVETMKNSEKAEMKMTSSSQVQSPKIEVESKQLEKEEKDLEKTSDLKRTEKNVVLDKTSTENSAAPDDVIMDKFPSILDEIITKFEEKLQNFDRKITIKLNEMNDKIEKIEKVYKKMGEENCKILQEYRNELQIEFDILSAKTKNKKNFPNLVTVKNKFGQKPKEVGLEKIKNIEELLNMENEKVNLFLKFYGHSVDKLDGQEHLETKKMILADRLGIIGPYLAIKK